nr:uncharacterized protein LOC129138876 [Pan troglodytes]
MAGVGGFETHCGYPLCAGPRTFRRKLRDRVGSEDLWSCFEVGGETPIWVAWNRGASVLGSLQAGIKFSLSSASLQASEDFYQASWNSSCSPVLGATGSGDKNQGMKGLNCVFAGKLGGPCSYHVMDSWCKPYAPVQQPQLPPSLKESIQDAQLGRNYLLSQEFGLLRPSVLCPDLFVPPPDISPKHSSHFRKNGRNLDSYTKASVCIAPLSRDWKEERKGTPKEGVRCKTWTREISTAALERGGREKQRGGRGDGKARSRGRLLSPHPPHLQREAPRPVPQPLPARSPPRLPPAPPAASGRLRAAARGAGVSTCHRAASAPSFRGTCPARRLPPALPHGRRPLLPAAPRAPRAPSPAQRPPGPVSASSWGDPGGGSPARSRLHPSAPASEQPPLPPPPPPSSHPGSVRPEHGALRMRRGAGAGLRARSGVVSAAPRAPARPPPSRAPRWGHAVSHLAGDQGDPGGPLHLRHPPHPLRDPLVHLPRCGL